MRNKAGNVGLAIVGALPEFVVGPLLRDDAFVRALDLPAKRIANIGDEIGLDQSEYVSALVRLYSGETNNVSLRERRGGIASLTLEHPDGYAIKIVLGDRTFRVRGHFGTRASAAERLSGLAEALDAAGLPPESADDWRAVAEVRHLTSEEIFEVDCFLSAGPQSVWTALVEQLKAEQSSMDVIVPASESYYSNLIGGASVNTLEELVIRNVPQVVAKFIHWRLEDGARAVLKLSMHDKMFNFVDFAIFDQVDMAALCKWALERGSLFSKVGALDVALRLPEKFINVESELKNILDCILRQDSESNVGELKFLTAAFIMTYGELSRSKALSDWPPFHRRGAALVHASVIVELLRDRVDVEHFSDWCFQSYGRRFYLQGSVDLCEEPRWIPESADPAQLRAEIIGRLEILTRRAAEWLPDGDFKKTLSSADGLASEVSFPASFLPGPLEGASQPLGTDLPSEIVAALDRSLCSPQLDMAAVATLINIQGIFQVENSRVDALIKLIEKSEYRFSSSCSLEDVENILAGLARVACVSHSKDLAGAVRILCRVRRREKTSRRGIIDELVIALRSAGAFDARSDWRRFVGEWISELAFSVDDKGEAATLYDDIITLCQIDPDLRMNTGRGQAALAAYLKG